MKWTAFFFTTSMPCNRSPNNHLLCAASRMRRPMRSLQSMWPIFARAMLARVCSWRAQPKGCAMLAALDVHEHFDNYFLHARHQTDADAIAMATVRRLGSIV